MGVTDIYTYGYTDYKHFRLKKNFTCGIEVVSIKGVAVGSNVSAGVDYELSDISTGLTFYTLFAQNLNNNQSIIVPYFGLHLKLIK